MRGWFKGGRTARDAGRAGAGAPPGVDAASTAGHSAAVESAAEAEAEAAGAVAVATGTPDLASRTPQPRPTESERATRRDVNDAVESLGERFRTGTAFVPTLPDGPAEKPAARVRRAAEQRQAVVAALVDTAIDIYEVTGIDVDPRDLLAAALDTDQSRREPAAGRSSSTSLAELAGWISQLGTPSLGEAADVRATALRHRAVYYAHFLEPAAPTFWGHWRDELRAEADRLEADSPRSPIPRAPAPALSYPLTEEPIDPAHLSAEIGAQWEFRRTMADPPPPPEPMDDTLF